MLIVTHCIVHCLLFYKNIYRRCFYFCQKLGSLIYRASIYCSFVQSSGDVFKTRVNNPVESPWHLSSCSGSVDVQCSMKQRKGAHQCLSCLRSHFQVLRERFHCCCVWFYECVGRCVCVCVCVRARVVYVWRCMCECLCVCTLCV